MRTYKDFLMKYRKKNGEKLLPKTIELYNSIIEKNKKDFLVYEKLEDLIQFMNMLINQNSNPYTKSSLKLYLLYLGIEEDDVRLSKLKKPRKMASAVNSIRILGEKAIPRKDMELLYDSLDDEWKLIVGFLYDTACRENELLNITYKDITERNDTNIAAEIRILGKGSKFRTVYLSQKTYNLFKKLRKKYDDTDKVFIFKKSNGKLFKRQEKYLIDKMHELTKNILGKTYTPHSFRHSRLTDLANSGADVLSISNYAGHSNLSTTQIYVKGAKSVSERMIKKIGGSL